MAAITAWAWKITPHWAIALGYSHSFTNTLVNEFHFGINHSEDNIVADEAYDYGLPAQYGIPGVPQSPGNGGLPIISIGSLTELGVRRGSHAGNGDRLRIADNVTKVYGRQTLKAGYQIDILDGNLVQPGWGEAASTTTVSSPISRPPAPDLQRFPTRC